MKRWSGRSAGNRGTACREPNNHLCRCSGSRRSLPSCWQHLAAQFVGAFGRFQAFREPRQEGRVVAECRLSGYLPAYPDAISRQHGEH